MTIFDLLRPMFNTAQTNVKCPSLHVHTPRVCTHIHMRSILITGLQGVANQSPLMCKLEQFVKFSCMGSLANIKQKYARFHGERSGCVKVHAHTHVHTNSHLLNLVSHPIKAKLITVFQRCNSSVEVACLLMALNYYFNY